MADERTYIKVHDGMPDHPKIDGLSDAAFRLLVTMWCWSSRHLTDGRVPAATWSKRGSARARGELMTAGLVEQAPDGALLLHDYLEHQRSADEVAALREKRRLAGSKGGKAKANALALAKQTDSKSVPESETDTEVLQKSLSDDPDIRSAFVEFWSIYPRRTGKRGAESEFTRAVKRSSVDAVLTGAKRYRDDPNRSDEFTKHPSTWLHNDCWGDDPLPGRASVRNEDDPMGWAR